MSLGLKWLMADNEVPSLLGRHGPIDRSVLPTKLSVVGIQFALAEPVELEVGVREHLEVGRFTYGRPRSRTVWLIAADGTRYRVEPTGRLLVERRPHPLEASQNLVDLDAAALADLRASMEASMRGLSSLRSSEVVGEHERSSALATPDDRSE